MSSPSNRAEIIYHRAFVDALRPEPRMLVSEWADEHRVLSAKAAAEPGRYRTSRTPYLREIMDTLSPYHPAEEVCFIKSTQVGATEAGNNWLGSVMDITPGAFLMVQPTVDLARRWSRQRLAPMIQDTPRLRNVFQVTDQRPKDVSKTVLMKDFDGGVLIMAGANSAAGLRSMPIRFLFMDEVDAYPEDCEGEGEPTELARKRTDTFSSRRKIFEASTPTDLDTSRITRRYEHSDQRRYHVPCPHCEELQVLEWRNVQWAEDEDKELTDVYMVCEHCGGKIDEHEKTWMLEQGQWIARYPNRKLVGFHINALYSPIGWKSWKSCVEEFLKAKRTRNVTLLKVWTNTVLAQAWEQEGRTVAHSHLYRRREHYRSKVPAGVVVLTAGVDTQDDRLEYEIVGYGEGEESWSVEHGALYGDPGRTELWSRLTQTLTRQHEHENGALMVPGAVCVDSGGHYTQQVYAYCHSQRHRRFYATKGSSESGQPIVSRPTKVGRDKTKLFRVGTDTAKELVYSRLLVQEPGPGYCHWPIADPASGQYDEEYFQQLTAEKAATRFVKGFQKIEWVKIRPRNEMLDCRVLSYAALLIWKPSLQTAPRSQVKRPTQQRQPARQQGGWFGGGQPSNSNTGGWFNR